MTCKKCGSPMPENSRYCPYCGKDHQQPKRTPRRRGNGTGTVYKRKDLKERPYVAYTPTTYNEEGEASREVIGYFSTLQEARDALERFRINPTQKLNITLQELFEEWKPLKYAGISKQGKGIYNAAWNKLAPLYKKRFREIRTAQMQSIIDQNQSMSYSSLSNIKLLLGSLYAYAMQNDIITRDYSKFITIPASKPAIKECFSDLELKKIEQAAGKVPYADWILCMCYTGFRITEFLTLTPFQYQLKDGIPVLIGGIKTKAGKNRIVPVHPKILSIVENQLKAGGETIFCRPDGSKYPSSYFRINCYLPALKEIGVRPLTPHATRRTFATLLSAAGAKPEDITRLMGHTDFKMDVDHYINQSTNTLYKAIEKL